MGCVFQSWTEWVVNLFARTMGVGYGKADGVVHLSSIYYITDIMQAVGGPNPVPELSHLLIYFIGSGVAVKLN
jgi:hypothetical protein